MTRRLAIIETYWYLSYQDGPVDDTKYPTKKAAKEALKELGERRGICIMSRSREVEP